MLYVFLLASCISTNKFSSTEYTVSKRIDENGDSLSIIRVTAPISLEHISELEECTHFSAISGSISGFQLTLLPDKLRMIDLNNDVYFESSLTGRLAKPFPEMTVLRMSFKNWVQLLDNRELTVSQLFPNLKELQLYGFDTISSIPGASGLILDTLVLENLTVVSEAFDELSVYRVRLKDVRILDDVRSSITESIDHTVLCNCSLGMREVFGLARVGDDTTHLLISASNVSAGVLTAKDTIEYSSYYSVRNLCYQRLLHDRLARKYAIRNRMGF